MLLSLLDEAPGQSRRWHSLRLAAKIRGSANDRPESVEELDRMLAACSVPPWTDADATAWWRTRGARLRAIRAGAAADEPTTEQRTVEVGVRA